MDFRCMELGRERHPSFPLQWRSSCIRLVLRRTSCGSVCSPRLSFRIHTSFVHKLVNRSMLHTCLKSTFRDVTFTAMKCTGSMRRLENGRRKVPLWQKRHACGVASFPGSFRGRGKEPGTHCLREHSIKI